MPVTVKSISLWRKEAANKTGLLAQKLEPLAKAGADLGVVMGYKLPGNEAKSSNRNLSGLWKKGDGCRHRNGACRLSYPDAPRRRR